MSDYRTPQPGGSDPAGQPPPPWGQAYGPSSYPPGGNRMETGDAGFFPSLFDYSFQHFVTPKIVKFVYVLATIGLALGYLFFVVAAFTRNVGSGILVLIGGALLALIYLAFIRMTLEFYYAIVRMSQDINRRLPPP